MQVVILSLLIEQMTFETVDLPDTVDCVWAFSTMIDLWWIISDRNKLSSGRDQFSESVVYYINVDPRALNGLPSS